MSTKTIPQSFKKAFIVDGTALKQLDVILANSKAVRTYSVTYKDKSSVEYTEVERLLELNNPRKNPIQKIRVATYDHELRLQCNVSLEDHLSTNISYNLSGSEQTTAFIASQLNDWIEEITPWYSRIATMDFFSMFIGCLAVTFTVLVLLAGTAYIIQNASNAATKPSASSDTTLGSAIFNLIVFSTIGAGIVFNRARSLIFPIGIFAIGNGVKRQRNSEKVREFIGTVVVTAIIVNLISSVLYSLINR